MPPKRRARAASDSSNLFQYNNQVEMTFKAQPKEKVLAKASTLGDSSDSEDDDVPILKKKGKKCADTSSSSSESSSASDSDNEFAKKPSENVQDDVYEIPDDNDDVGPRPLTPPPNVTNIRPSLKSSIFSRTVGEKMRKLEFLQKAAEQDTPSPVTSTSDIVIMDGGVDSGGTPTSARRNITVRVRISNAVERFSIKRNDKFEEIFSQLATKYNVKVDALSLSFTDTTGTFQNLKGTDTPNSVNLDIADIIDCVVIQATPNLNGSFGDCENVVKIKFQGSGGSKTVKQFKAIKDKPLGKVMQQYADFRQLPLSQLKFSFDGETMTSEQCPDDLDMDDDNVVDVQTR